MITTKDGTEYDIDQIATGNGAKYKIVYVKFGPYGWYLVWKRGWLWFWNNIEDGDCYISFDVALEKYHEHMKACNESRRTNRTPT